MSIEKSIQNLIKAIQQPTRYMGDETSIKVVPKPGNDPCAPLFTPSLVNPGELTHRTDIAADTICKFLEGINSCSYLNEHNNRNCKPDDFFWRREEAHGKMPGAEILNAGHVDGICETYANSVLAATNGLSEIQKIEIKRTAKCKCYKYALEGGPVITPPPTNGIQTIFPRHLQEQILRAFGGRCSVVQLRAMCATLNSIRGVYLRKRGDQGGLGCQLSTTLST
jgi:hypothetical protein